MDIKKLLLAGYSRENADLLVSFIKDDKDKFSVLMKMVFGEDKILSQRASWVMTGSIEKYPQLANPYLDMLIDFMEHPITGFHISVFRHIVRSFQYIEIPEDYHGRMIDIAFCFVMDRKEAIAIRAYAITILENFVRLYPELKDELIQVLKLEMDYTTAAFKSRARKIIAKEGK